MNRDLDTGDIAGRDGCECRSQSGSWALLMMLSERDVCTIRVKTSTFVSTSGADRPLDSRNDRAALHYPDHGSRRRRPATKRVVARCEHSTTLIPD